jgi:hypothetical protein
MIRRSVGLALVAALVAIALPRAARADVTGIGVPDLVELQIQDANGNFKAPATDQDRLFYFNRAHCECALAGATNGTQFKLRLHIKDKPATSFDSSAPFWSGSSCEDATLRAQCEETQTAVAHYDTDLVSTTTDYGFSLLELMSPSHTKMHTTCPSKDAGTGTITLLVDTAGNGTLEKVTGFDVKYDTKAPDLPGSPVAVGGEGAIDITFDPPTSTTDLLYYQALCSLAGTGTVVPTAKVPAAGARYRTAFQLCSSTAEDVTFRDVQVPNSDGKTSTALDTLDAGFLCGEAAGTATDVRIEGLVNGTAYNVILLAIDKYGNAGAIRFVGSVTPVPVTDFWEDEQGQGSQVESGFCLISDTYGDGGPLTDAMRSFRDDTLASNGLGRAFTSFYYAHVAWIGEYARAWWPLRIVLAVVLLPFVLLAIAWHALTLPGLLAVFAAAWWLRRRRRRAVPRAVLASAAGLAILIGSGAARAQTDDDWDAAAIDETEVTIDVPKWVVGVKLGPYVPDIDRQFQQQTGKTTRPYHEMFGGYNLVPMVDIDRVVWDGFGQVTVGGSIGFLTKTAHAFANGSTPGGMDRPRSDGDSNSFRMIPMALLAGYRFTYLDDQWGVPIVPYARGGLAYYAWWVKAPNSNLAYVEEGGTRQTGIGASLGLQGAVGISIRAERIDPDSASSMRQGGISHAAFYGELQAGWVDGFGNAKRLSLGDKTWFAGVNFEF